MELPPMAQGYRDVYKSEESNVLQGTRLLMSI